jgi:hypothetical protein
MLADRQILFHASLPECGGFMLDLSLRLDHTRAFRRAIQSNIMTLRKSALQRKSRPPGSSQTLKRDTES